MKHTLLFLVLGLLTIPAGASADDFGARFSNAAPAAFGDNINTVSGEFDPSLIEPAAGNPSADAFSEDSIEKAPSGQTPEQLISEIEKIMQDIETNLEANE